MNVSFADVWTGRGYTTQKDVAVAVLTITFSILQILFGFVALWILKKLAIFHNAFGFFCAARTIAEMLSNLIHLSFSAPATLIQDRDLNPAIAVILGYLSYSLAATSCALHATVSVNRFVCVYFPLRYWRMFTIRRCAFFLAFLCILPLLTLSLYFVIPCNLVGYSPVLYGYVAPGCPGVNSFRVSTAARKSDRTFRRNVRFFAQSTFINIPMNLEVAFLALGGASASDERQFERTVSFILTRFTDFVNAASLIIFNPEAQRLLAGTLYRQVSVVFM